MKRYNSEDYYSVINKKTGIKIALLHMEMNIGKIIFIKNVKEED